MPHITDNTNITITRVQRDNGRLVVQMQLTDSVTGADKGTIEQSWEEATELPQFLAQNQTLENCLCHVIGHTCNAVTGEYEAETLTGKTFDAAGKEIV